MDESEPPPARRKIPALKKRGRGTLQRGPRCVGSQFSVNVLLNVPEPSLVVTPFSKKQPPPNDRPTVCTFLIATIKASMTSVLSVPNLPFQSDHMLGALTGWLMNPEPLGTSVTLIGFDHQNCV